MNYHAILLALRPGSVPNEDFVAGEGGFKWFGSGPPPTMREIEAAWPATALAIATQQIGLVMMGAALPADIMWKTVGGAFVEMTPALAGQIFQATAARDVALFAAAEAHIAAAEASDDPRVYDFTAGWPA